MVSMLEGFFCPFGCSSAMKAAGGDSYTSIALREAAACAGFKHNMELQRKQRLHGNLRDS